jgi:hypothetical protein
MNKNIIEKSRKIFDRKILSKKEQPRLILGKGLKALPEIIIKEKLDSKQYY